MANLNINKKIGIVLLVLFGAFLLSSLYNFSMRFVDWYNPTAASIIWLFINLLCCAATAYAAKHKDFFSNRIGVFASYGLACLYLLYTVNNITGLFEINIFKYVGLGNYTSLTLEIISVILMGGFLFSLKTWLPSKIAGILVYVPSFISSFLILKLNKAWEAYEATHDYEPYEKLISSLDVCSNLCMLFYIATLVLTIVWMCKKTPTPSYQNKPIDLI